MEQEVRRAAERLRALGGDPGDPADLAEQPYVLAQLAGDLALDRDTRHDLAGLADAAGIETDRAAELLRVLGIDVPAPGVVRFTDDDITVLRTIVDAPARWVREEEVAELLRVIGRTMATTAEASIAYHLRSIEPHVADLADWVDANHEMASLSRRLGAQLGPIYRHHLRQAIDLQRSVNAGAGRGEILDVAVAFVDLTGFTGMSLDLDLVGLGDVVTRLDVLATDAARAHRSRVVKLIGDEAMFVGADPVDLVGAAWQFVDAIGGEDIDAHGAVTHGRVTMNQGDYFGPVVNLAARLVDHAGPGELLGDAAVAAVVPSEPAGRRDVRGLPDPVTVYRLSR